MTQFAAEPITTTHELPDGGTIVVAGDPRWDAARAAWNLAVDQRPAAVALPRSARDVAVVVSFARRNGMSVTAQGTGHSAAVHGDLRDTLLVKTDQMRTVEIDPGRRVARVGAGVTWSEVVQAAAPHGLAALAGSSPDVGVVGYTLGGGLSWLGRRHGLAANSVTAIDVVTADGDIRRVDAHLDPDLFWALRGGGGNFGIVTAIEFRLLPVTTAYAGVLWWPIDRDHAVLTAWRDIVAGGVPDELTTVARYLRLPPLPEIPEPVRGKAWVVVEVIYLGEPAAADVILQPLRALNPILDTVTDLPIQALSHLHMDPQHPAPGAGDGALLASLPEPAVQALISVAGSGVDSSLLSLEVRHIGGALRRPVPDGGAVSAFEAEFALFAIGIAPTPDAATLVKAEAARVVQAVAPWHAATMYMNFAETVRDPSTLWTPAAYRRLRQVKARVDPHNILAGNHRLLPQPDAEPPSQRPKTSR